jgi:hypothetical protein
VLYLFFNFVTTSLHVIIDPSSSYLLIYMQRLSPASSTFIVLLLLLSLSSASYGLDTADVFVSTGPGLPQGNNYYQYNCLNCRKIVLILNFGGSQNSVIVA